MLKRIFLVVLIVAMGCGWALNACAKGEVPRMTKEQLKERLGASDLIVLDVRAAQDWNAGDKKIAGAVREDPESFDRWAAKYPKKKTLVLYCA